MIKKVTVNWYLETKLKITIQKTKQSYNLLSVIKQFIENQKWVYLPKITKINYTQLFQKSNKNDDKNGLAKVIILCIVLNKKQIYANVFNNTKKIIHLSNGIVLKKHGILEKSRKKETKISLTTINEILKLINLTAKKNKFDLIINIKKTKSIIGKIIRILFTTKLLGNKKKTLIISPKINFGCSKFKKVKSIKRRLRKKYKLINV